MHESGFLTIASAATAELSIKHSKFIAHAGPVDSRERAEAFVANLSEQFADATHNCFAYKIGPGENAIFRFSDAGEPSGTAGRPILQAIETRKLTNVVVVVTRYFGGTKLGTGGLVRAYSAAALAALENATILKKYPQVQLRIRFSYQLTNAVQQVLSNYGAEITDSRFGEMVSNTVKIKARDRDDFINDLQDHTGGKIVIG